MSLAFMISIIAIIPFLLGLALFNVYGKSKLTSGIFWIMLLLTIWQLDITVLYFADFLNKDLVLILFKFFRGGLIFAIPTIFYLAFIAFELEGNKSKSKSVVDKIIRIVVNKKAIITLYIWSAILYLINWTKYGIQDLKIIRAKSFNLDFYYPVYGDLNFLFYIHTLLYLVGFIFSLITIRTITNKPMKQFMNTFMYSTMSVYILAVFNLNPNNGILIGSIGVIIFSILIASSFIKMYNEMENNYNAILERQNKLDYVGNITSSLIHEVKNGLAVIQGYSQILPTTQEFNDETKELLQYIEISSSQLSEFVKGYQEFLKNQKIEFEDVLLSKVLDKALIMSSTLIEDNRFTVDVNVDKTIKAYVNDTYLTQVFLNLIKNSIEATPDEEHRKKLSINVSLINDFILIHFKDSGKGIPKDKWERVFYPFNSDKEKGTGLGLPYCKQVVFSHRGDICITESDDNGTSFQIKIPRYRFSDYMTGDN